MSPAPAGASHDYNALAADFDRYLPLIEPVAVALLAHLPAPKAGETVLDVSCGTGEPGLTLARTHPQARLVGIDSAAAMVGVAQAKAAREGLTNARFEVMSSDALALPDGGADAVISRFGLLMFGDVPASARELGRVLRAGGRFSLAVWDALEQNTLMSTMLTVLRGHLPPDHVSPMAGVQQWAACGVRAQLLQDAGLGVVESEMFAWSYRFARFDEVWDLLGRMSGFTGQATLPAAAQERVRTELHAALAAYRQADGVYVIPHACRLLWGER